MNHYRTYNQILLHRIEARITAQLGSAYDPTTRLELLEAIASRVGGFFLADYRREFPTARDVATEAALDMADELMPLIKREQLHPSLLLAALAQRERVDAKARRTGEYYTDCRLAMALAAELLHDLSGANWIIDPAVGGGMLLVAIALQLASDNRNERSRLVRDVLGGTDLRPHALRGARLALASLTDDLDAVTALNARLTCWDSLAVPVERWESLISDRPGVLVANPPWEKVKLSRHEYLLLAGKPRHYGSQYSSDFDDLDYQIERRTAEAYSQFVHQHYPCSRGGEADLYKPFTELAVRLTQNGGSIGLIVPAGLIRSQGAGGLRTLLFEQAASLNVQVLDNRARFFAIDSRFKFLLLTARMGAGNRRPLRRITLSHGSGAPGGINTSARVHIDVRTLTRTRPDLTIPEVATERAWRLFKHVYETGQDWASPESPWSPHFAREIDMTHAQSTFATTRRSQNDVAVVEGRMVQQHRFGAKAYVSGSGRRATWLPLPLGHSRLQPQYWMAHESLPETIQTRIQRPRVGFCDVTGQTNERSMLAALIPAQVVCGNKVPTILFAEGKDDDIPFAWLGIVNSFAFDWILRRVITTSVNYFLLRSIPFPAFEPTSLPARRIAAAARSLAELDRAGGGYDTWKAGELRGFIEGHVMLGYRMDLHDAAHILSDFPLLDRAQPPLPGEPHSTITRDVVLRSCAEVLGGDTSVYAERVEAARAAGAVAFMPGELARQARHPRDHSATASR